MKQPVLGIVSTAAVIAISLGFISLFSLSTFTTWIAYLMICCVPTAIVIGVTWDHRHPRFTAVRPQPAKGLLFLALTVAVGAVVALIHFATVGGRVVPPAPMLAMCIITSVINTFWLTIVWGGWPFHRLVRNPVAAGFVLLAASYAVNYLLFRLFFNYDFMRASPAYVSALDPHGLFNAWRILAFSVTLNAVMFLMLCFDLWPFARSETLMRQPLLGILWTASILLIGGVLYYIGVNLLGMDAPVFMVRVPIPCIFGTIIVLNMMQGSLFRRRVQPLKGLLNAAAAVVLGSLLAWAYGAVAPALSGTVRSGPPAYDFEIWLASALLAVTFPLLVVFSGYFQFWPLQRASSPRK